MSEPDKQTLAQLETYADLCWAEVTAEYRDLSSEDRERIMDSLEKTELTAVMTLPGYLLKLVCGLALAAVVEARLRVERQNIDEGNEYDDHYGNFEPD